MKEMKLVIANTIGK